LRDLLVFKPMSEYEISYGCSFIKCKKIPCNNFLLSCVYDASIYLKLFEQCHAYYTHNVYAQNVQRSFLSVVSFFMYAVKKGGVTALLRVGMSY
jgi:hypothetical protein